MGPKSHCEHFQDGRSNIFFKKYIINKMYVQASTLETLPRDILFQILLNLKGAALLNLCNTNRSLFNFCQESNDYFWQQKVLLDYQDKKGLPKPNHLGWKQYYIELGTTQNFIKQIPVSVDEKEIGYIWISVNNTEREILDSSNKLFLRYYPKGDPISLSNDVLRSLEWRDPLKIQATNTMIQKRDYDKTKYLDYRLTWALSHRAIMGIMSNIDSDDKLLGF